MMETVLCLSGKVHVTCYTIKVIVASPTKSSATQITLTTITTSECKLISVGNITSQHIPRTNHTDINDIVSITIIFESLMMFLVHVDQRNTPENELTNQLASSFRQSARTSHSRTRPIVQMGQYPTVPFTIQGSNRKRRQGVVGRQSMRIVLISWTIRSSRCLTVDDDGS